MLFLSAAFGLCVAGEATYEQRWPYPTTEAVVTDYDAHVGDRTLLFGSVEAVSGDRATIRVVAGGENLTMTVSDFTASVEAGGAIQVTGTLRPDHVVQADSVVVVNRSTDAKTWKYGASVVGLLVFLGLFFRFWRADLRNFQVVCRDDG
ncbi:hypothetical protein ACKVMT_13450 [Halobacteriales archaeon Cl-PHB]